MTDRYAAPAIRARRILLYDGVRVKFYSINEEYRENICLHTPFMGA